MSLNHRIVLATAALGLASTTAHAVPEYSPLPEAQVCQEQVRDQFLSRNRDLDVELAFPGRTLHEEVGPHRERITGEARVRGEMDTRPLTYECVVNLHTNRVLDSHYDLEPRERYRTLR